MRSQHYFLILALFVAVLVVVSLCVGLGSFARQLFNFGGESVFVLHSVFNLLAGNLIPVGSDDRAGGIVFAHKGHNLVEL